MVALRVANVPQEERYEATTSDGDLVGYLTYRVLGRLVVLIAIEVEPQYQTPDVESEILTAAMNDIRERELLMLPVGDVGYITSIVNASHNVDNARMLIQANRSVLTWTSMVNESIVPARSRLRDIAHDLTNWSKAGMPVFVDSDRSLSCLEDFIDGGWRTGGTGRTTSGALTGMRESLALHGPQYRY